MTVVVEVKRLVKLFEGGRVHAVDGVDLATEEGEYLVLLGPSGCGKTTLLRMVAGLETPSSGSVRVGGRLVDGPGPDRAVVFQQFALFPWKTVRENIAFGLKCKGVAKAERDAVALRYLELMGMSGTEDSYPHQLSGGMQQRVAIARALAERPRLLLMDEPFGALDEMTRERMQNELDRIAGETDAAVVFVTHSIPEAVFLSDRVVVMSPRPGRITATVDVDLPTRDDAVRQSDKYFAAVTEVRQALRGTQARAATP